MSNDNTVNSTQSESEKYLTVAFLEYHDKTWDLHTRFHLNLDTARDWMDDHSECGYNTQLHIAHPGQVLICPIPGRGLILLEHTE